MKLVEEKQKVVLQEDFFLKGEKKKKREAAALPFLSAVMGQRQCNEDPEVTVYSPLKPQQKGQ